jgi:hypothetical protein
LKNLKIQTGPEPEPVQTDRFRFGSVFLSEKPENLYYCFFGPFWAFLGFFGLFNGLSDGLVINVNII